MHMNFQNIHDLVYLNILSFSWHFLCLFLASFKEVIFILVSEDYLDVVWILRAAQKIAFVFALTFLGVHDNGWLLKSIYQKGIPRIFVKENVKTTTNKFQDEGKIFLCWKWTLPRLQQKLIRNISRSKACLFHTSTYSLITLWKAARRQKRY